jgi:hypothetical protein
MLLRYKQSCPESLLCTNFFDSLAPGAWASRRIHNGSSGDFPRDSAGIMELGSGLCFRWNLDPGSINRSDYLIFTRLDGLSHFPFVKIYFRGVLEFSTFKVDEMSCIVAAGSNGFPPGNALKPNHLGA